MNKKQYIHPMIRCRAIDPTHIMAGSISIDDTPHNGVTGQAKGTIATFEEENQTGNWGDQYWPAMKQP